VKSKALVILLMAVAVILATFFLVILDGDKDDSGQTDIQGTTDQVKINVTNNIKSLSKKTDGSFEILYEYIITNTLPDKKVNKITAVNDLVASFKGHKYTIQALSSSRFDIRNDFDGKAQKNLFTGTNSLDPSQSGTVSLGIVLYPDGDEGPFENYVQVYGVLSGMPDPDSGNDGDNNSSSGGAGGDSGTDTPPDGGDDGSGDDSGDTNVPGDDTPPDDNDSGGGTPPDSNNDGDSGGSNDGTGGGTSNENNDQSNPQALGEALVSFVLDFTATNASSSGAVLVTSGLSIKKSSLYSVLLISGVCLVNLVTLRRIYKKSKSGESI